MRANFIKTNSLNWYDYIQDFSDSKNTNRDAKTGKTPLSLIREYFAIYRSYIVEYRFVENSRQTFQEELKPILELCRGEDWFIPKYENYIDG